MFDFIQNIRNDLHPMIVHFAIAALFLSFAFTLAARMFSHAAFDQASWLLPVVGVAAAVPSTVTGLIAHLSYEETAVAASIEPHQFLGILGTLVAMGVLIWRFLARRRGQDIGAHPAYVALAVIGLAWLVLLGGTGGNLVFQHAVNVRGITPLLE